MRPGSRAALRSPRPPCARPGGQVVAPAARWSSTAPTLGADDHLDDREQREHRGPDAEPVGRGEPGDTERGSVGHCDGEHEQAAPQTGPARAPRVVRPTSRAAVDPSTLRPPARPRGRDPEGGANRSCTQAHDRRARGMPTAAPCLRVMLRSCAPPRPASYARPGTAAPPQPSDITPATPPDPPNCSSPAETRLRRAPVPHQAPQRGSAAGGPPSSGQLLRAWSSSGQLLGLRDARGGQQLTGTATTPRTTDQNHSRLGPGTEGELTRPGADSGAA